MDSRIEVDRMDYTEVTGRQLRAARVLLDWTKLDAARECKVGVNSIGRFEEGAATQTARTAEDIVRTFERAGVVFVRAGSSAGVLLDMGPESL